jgi:type II secretory pathway component GspD/PulD (secretin)
MPAGSGKMRLLGLALLAAAAWACTTALAQEGQPMPVDMNNLPPEVRAKMMERGMRMGRGGPMPGMQPGGGAPAETPPAGETPKPEGEGQPAGDAAAGVETVKRSDAEGPADPEELKAKPDANGQVQFTFKNQTWPDVLQWFSEVSNATLDWQELPADKVNIITQRKYSLPETRDLLNRYLLARGFTMLQQGEVITVMKLDKIEPSLVPRVEPDDLEEHLPYEFARVRFDVPEPMDPAKAVEDVKALLTPTAKVTPLLASRQIMVIDPVANLRDVRDLLYGEQLSADGDIRPELFQIRHRRADYVADQIMIVLGMDPSSRKSPMELQLEQQRMQLLMQMQGSGKDVSQMLQQDGPPVFLAVDRRLNTISANAPPKEMEIIKRVVKQFDVPSNIGGLADSGELTTKRYQTATVSADSVVTALKEIANLSPLTQLQSDSGSKTIFATATAEDHATIQGMIDRLDGSGRSIRVVWLSRRTPVDQVAGTIQALMVGEKKEESPRRSYYYYDPWSSRNNNESEDAGFRIQADIENNRLILMATDDEFEEVTGMLTELGVITNGRQGNPNTFRVLDARSPADTAELLKRIEQAWGGRNPLNVNVAPPEVAPGAAPSETPADEPAETPSGDAPATDEDTLTRRAGLPKFILAQYAEGDSIEANPESAAAVGPEVEAEVEAEPRPPAPINLTVTSDGRIVISSDDPVALDQMEDLLAELAPPPEDFKLYKLKNSDCRDVWYNLTDYFEEELADDENDRFMRLWNGFYEKTESATLGKRRKLRFIWDTATNSILVQNASPAQLQTVDKLIEIYDQPVADDAVRRRKTELVQVKYSRAGDIAEAVKEVYRDLLSSKDKEFQNRDGENNQRGGGGGRSIYYSFGGGGTDNKSSPVKMSFEGALSIGVDQVSNTLIVSAEEQIFDSIKQMITSLDEQARSETVVQVHQLTGSLDAEELQDALQTALSTPWAGGKPQNQAQGGRGGRGGGERGRGEWGRRGRGDWRGGDRDRGRD